MHNPRQHSEPDRFPQDGAEPATGAQSRGAGWIPELILSGLALALPALAFTAAALVSYPPAAKAMAPVAVGLCLVGLGLVLIGIVARRRLGRP